jgi:hypothetical protein
MKELLDTINSTLPPVNLAKTKEIKMYIDEAEYILRVFDRNIDDKIRHLPCFQKLRSALADALEVMVLENEIIESINA